MPDYKKGKIYKLVSDQTNDVYIGSTCQTLCQRLNDHKCRMRQHEAGKQRFTTSQNIVKYNDVKIILIEDFPCERKEQLTARERFYIENNECVNKIIPNRTREEYIKTDARKETSKKYYEKNKEHYEEYRENTKEQKAQYDKEFREKNKEKIQAKRGVKITCECGGKYTMQHKAAHFKTQMHIKNLL